MAEFESGTLTWALDGGRTIDIKYSVPLSVWAPTYYAEKFGAFIVGQPLSGRNVLDVGCGSGVLAILAAKLGANVTATDLNPDAIENTLHNAKLNDVVLNSYLSDGLEEVLSRNELFDLIVCNSPSIPEVGAPPAERRTRTDWAMNGPKGRSLLDAVLFDGPSVLKREGRLLTCSNSEQGWDDTVKALKHRWSKFRILEDCTFPMDLPEYREHLERWKAVGAVWDGLNGLCHSARFVMAYK